MRRQPVVSIGVLTATTAVRVAKPRTSKENVAIWYMTGNKCNAVDHYSGVFMVEVNKEQGRARASGSALPSTK